MRVSMQSQHMENEAVSLCNQLGINPYNYVEATDEWGGKRSVPMWETIAEEIRMQRAIFAMIMGVR